MRIIIIGYVIHTALFFTLGCQACFDGPSAPVPNYRHQPKDGATSIAETCTPNISFCDGNQVKHCNDQGIVVSVVPCGSTETCVEGICEANIICQAGQTTCVGNTLQTCNSEGTEFSQQDCGQDICTEGACVEPQVVCPPLRRFCRDNTAYYCNETGTGYVDAPENCQDRLCVDGVCESTICTPGLSQCHNNIARTCNSIGTDYIVDAICLPPESCVLGRCRELVCPNTRWCNGNTATTCNTQLTEIIEQRNCGSAGCAEGTCISGDGGEPRDGGGVDNIFADHNPPDRQQQDRRQRDRLHRDRLQRDRRGIDTRGADTTVRDHNSTDRVMWDTRTRPDRYPVDRWAVPDTTPSSCPEIPCMGFSYCQLTTGQCLFGCEQHDQCGTTGHCNILTHRCESADAGITSADTASLPQQDGSGHYSPDGSEVIVEELCPASDYIPPGCLNDVMEGTSGLCDGLDNDCDGWVDEGCRCRLGQVQRCFKGPPARHNVGACEDGLQTCVSRITSPASPPLWGPCRGGIEPSAEVCDDLDNNCNGCVDEIEGCVAAGSCPGPGDPRVPDGAPFSTYPLSGSDFFFGDDAVAWHWSVAGTPCDKMFLELPGSVANSDNGQLSYRVHNAHEQNAAIDFTLSGDYHITLDVDRSNGQRFSCTWILHVRAPGLRVELCWDATGPTASSYGGTLDIDLHLGKTGTTSMWFNWETDCDYMSCPASNQLHEIWGYATTPIENCTGPGARGSFWDACPNPRLDIDNISESAEYVPENINLDNPNDGDAFRVMVHHYDFESRAAKPLVNVYCGGELRGTYGAYPDQVLDFSQGGGRDSGSMWRVVDVVMEVEPSGKTTGCNLSPLIDGEGAFVVTVDDSTY